MVTSHKRRKSSHNRPAAELHSSLVSFLHHAHDVSLAAARGKREHPFTCKVQLTEDPAAGRALVLAQDVEPDELVLYLPPDALLHVEAARSFFPAELVPQRGNSTNSESSQVLRATALLPLLLTVLKAEPGTRASFIRSLPTDFDSVPLTWTQHSTPEHKRLLSAQPPRIASQTAAIEKRYLDDLRAARQAFTNHREAIEASAGGSLPDWTDSVYLWAWLCVNSRCVFLPLGLEPHADNFTLAPMLDMANHTLDKWQEYHVEWTQGKGLELRAPHRSPSSSTALAAGSAVCIRYGAHGNADLLTEYGFVLPSNPYSDVLLDEELLSLLEAHPQSKLLRETLEMHGYWKDWTLQATPPPAHPSWRTVMAIRLLADPSSATTVWADEVNGTGKKDFPAEIDLAAMRLLRNLCRTLHQRLQTDIEPLDALCKEALSKANGLRVVLREELFMLQQVMDACENESLPAPW